MTDLDRIYALFRHIESAVARDGAFPADELTELQRCLRDLHSHPRIEVSKLAGIAAHLHPQMSLRTFVHFLVPLERALQRRVQDDDFLVRSEDLSSAQRTTVPVHLVLDNLRSAFNVGSLFRTAEGLGVERIHLCGYTAGPSEEKTRRASLGTENMVPWQHHDHLATAIQTLRTQNIRVVALETAARSQPLQTRFLREPTAFVFGNERFGLESDALALCDEVRELPMSGRKNSLNVAVMAALAVYEWKRQWSS